MAIRVGVADVVAAVASNYGWGPGLSDGQVPERLLSMNLGGGLAGA